MDSHSKHLAWAKLHLWVVLSITVTLILNIVALICAAVWAAARRKINDEPYHAQPSNAKLVFYTFTMPILTFFQTPIELSLALKGILSPTIALVTSTFFLCGWIVQIGFWFYCEVSSGSILESIPPWCPNSAQDPIVGQVKPFVGVFVAVAFCVCMSLSAVAIAKGRPSEDQAILLPKRSHEGC